MKIKNINSNDINFLVRVVEDGEKYGLNQSLTHSGKEPLVEFYDSRFEDTEYGQFISRYNKNTLIDMPSSAGLILDGNVPEWTIDSNAINEITLWLKNPNKPKI